jgi:hypothetical protein
MSLQDTMDAPPVTEDHGPLDVRLATLHTVSVDHTDLKELKECHRSTHLRALNINGAVPLANSRSQLRAVLEVEMLLHYVGQPRLDRLIIRNTVILSRRHPQGSQYPLIDHPNYINPLSTPALHNSEITREALIRLLSACSTLRHLTLTRTAVNTQNILLYQLPDTIRPLGSTLVSLTMGYEGGGKRPGRTLLPPMTHLPRLLHLKIDPCLYVGLRICPHWPLSPPNRARHPVLITRPPWSFAEVLPAGIETLALDIDMEQVMRIPVYRRDIVQSIVAYKDRLHALKEITMLEDPTTFTRFRVCSCNVCYREMRFIWRDGRRDSEETKERKGLVKALKEKGVKLFLDLANGQGRKELVN